MSHFRERGSLKDVAFWEWKLSHFEKVTQGNTGVIRLNEVRGQERKATLIAAKLICAAYVELMRP